MAKRCKHENVSIEEGLHGSWAWSMESGELTSGGMDCDHDHHFYMECLDCGVKHSCTAFGEWRESKKIPAWVKAILVEILDRDVRG